MVQLYALVYASTAQHAPTRAELDRLLERARDRNARLGVTGLLLYSSLNFMQYLEGPAEGMHEVFECIKADPLHHGIIELLREPIREREFPDWQMGFRSISGFGTVSPPEVDAVFIARLEPGGPPPSAAQLMLSKFWNKGLPPRLR